MNKKEKETLAGRYPAWHGHIANGNFKVYSANGKKVVEWANTSIFCPNLKQLEMIIFSEFPGERPENIVFLSGIQSLSVTSDGIRLN